MSAEVSDQLRDLAGRIDEWWVPQDPERLRAGDPGDAGDPGEVDHIHLVGRSPSVPAERPRRPVGWVLAIAACVALLVGAVAVVVRAGDDDRVTTGDDRESPATDEGAWRPASDLAYTDRSLSIEAPSVWTGRELLLVGALVEPFDAAGLQDPASSGLKVFETPAYDPVADAWHLYPAPPVRMSGTVHAVWTGTEVLAVSSDGFSQSGTGGLTSPTYEGEPSPGSCQGTTGAVTTVASLDPATGTWTDRAVPTVEAGTVNDVVWDGARAWLVHADGCIVGYDPATDTYGDPISPDPAAMRSATAGSRQPGYVESAAPFGGALALSFQDASGLVSVDLTTGEASVLPGSAFSPSETVGTDAGLVRIFPTTEAASIVDVGSVHWRDLADPPLAARSPARTPATWTGTSVVIWGGSAVNPAGGGYPPGEMPPWLGDGALLDPATGSWTHIPAAPGVELNSSFGWAGDRLVVWHGGNVRDDPDGVIHATAWQPG